MSKKSKLLSLGAVAISVTIIVMFIQGTTKKPVPVSPVSDGRPHFIIALYDQSHTDSPQFKVDAIYRVIKDSVIIVNHDANTANIKAYSDTSYFVIQDIPAFDRSGNPIKDSTQKGYVVLDKRRLVKDCGTIDSSIANYKLPKK